MRKRLAACFMLACGSALAADIPLQGTYGTLFGCSAERTSGFTDDGRPKLRLTHNELQGVEFGCSVAAIMRRPSLRGTATFSWRVELSCAGEGDTWRDVAAVIENRTTGTVSITAESFAPDAELDYCALPYETRVQREADRLTKQ